MLRWFRKSSQPDAPFEAGISQPTTSTFTDGVDYSQPPVVPYYVERDENSVQQYLEHIGYNTGSAHIQRQTYRFQFDGNRSAMYDGRVNMPIDDPLCEWDYITRRDVLTNCHAAYQRNPLAKSAVDLTRRFVVGKGHTITAMNEEVQAVIDAFRANKENYVFGYDRAFIQDLQIDGELFVRFYTDDAGQVVIAQVPPWMIQGADTEPGFFRRVRNWLFMDETQAAAEPTPIPADDMLHIAINNHGYELRGRPDLFVILPWLRAYNEWITDRARQNKWRNALLWMVQVASKVPGAVSKIRAMFRVPPTPGSVVVLPDSVNVQAVSNPVGAGDAAEDGRQIKLQSIVGLGLPEYMMADGENANLASATAQQLPALWKFTDGQQLMAEEVWTPIYKRVIQAAVDAGMVSEEVEVQDPDGDPVTIVDPDTGAQSPVDKIKAVDAFEVSYYELQADDPKTLAEAYTALTTTRISSTETAREKMGLNHRIEEKRLQREESAAMDRATQGRDTDLSGEPMQDPDEDEQPQGQRNGARSE